MNKNEAFWRLRQHLALIILPLVAVIIITSVIYSIRAQRPDHTALTVGLDDAVILTISDNTVEQSFVQGADTDKVKVIRPSLKTVVVPTPQTNKYVIYENKLITQSCDLMISNASTAKELFELGLIEPIEQIDCNYQDMLLAGCLEIGYADITGQGDYVYPNGKDTVCAFVLKNSNNKQEALKALYYLQNFLKKQPTKG